MIKKQARPVQNDDRTVPSEFMNDPEASQKQAHGKTARTNIGKLSLYPLSVEDALRAAAQTGRVMATKPKRPNQKKKSKKRSIAT
jgi:hypothetical protein